MYSDSICRYFHTLLAKRLKLLVFFKQKQNCLVNQTYSAGRRLILFSKLEYTELGSQPTSCIEHLTSLEIKTTQLNFVSGQ